MSRRVLFTIAFFLLSVSFFSSASALLGRAPGVHLSIARKSSILSNNRINRFVSDISSSSSGTISSLKAVQYRGGAMATPQQEQQQSDNGMHVSSRRALLNNIAGVWGVTQVIYIFGNAIKRLYPVAVEPIIKDDMTSTHWTLYAVWCAYMAYVEGYKAFHLKFSPSVVERSFGIGPDPSLVKLILAGPYAMGLFGATKTKMIVSWCITVGVFGLTKLVKGLPYPYRGIVDAGVVLGLSMGLLSMVYHSIKTLMGPRTAAPTFKRQ